MEGSSLSSAAAAQDGRQVVNPAEIAGILRDEPALDAQARLRAATASGDAGPRPAGGHSG